MNKKSFVIYAAPVLLCIVAINQQVRSQLGELTPWKGGGFGMFSSTDSGRNRFVYIYLQTADERVAATCPRKLNWDLEKIRAYPQKWRLESLANKLKYATWVDFGIVSGTVNFRAAIPTNDYANSKANSEVGHFAKILGRDQNKDVSTFRLVATREEVGDEMIEGKNLEPLQLTVEVWKTCHQNENASLILMNSHTTEFN